MVLRRFVVAMAAVGLIVPSLAHALAIGDIKTRSALNQPYLGEVLLTDVGDLSADDIHVVLASNAEFQQMGVDRSQALGQLQFHVVKRNDGTALIKVSTDQPVTEPDLDFVLRVTWPGNTSLREFVALLDLPSSSSSPASEASVATPVASAPVAQPAPVAAQAPAPTEQPADKAAAAASTPTRNSAAEVRHYHPRSGETLWRVAHRLHPSGTTVAQTMLAIEKANPGSFPSGNVNQMDTGRSLLIPAASEIRRIGAREAAQAVSEQDHAWHRNESASPQPLAAAQVNASSQQTVAPSAPAQARSEVHLIAPGTAGQHKTAAAVGAKISENNQLANQLMKENELLKAQLEQDQQQIKQQQQMLALEDQKLAELEVAIKQLKTATGTGTPAAASGPASGPAPSAPPVATPASIPTQPQSVVTVPSPPVKPVNPPDKNPEKQVASGNHASSSSAPAQPVNYLLWGGISLAGFAALVGGLIAWRRFRDPVLDEDWSPSSPSVLEPKPAAQAEAKADVVDLSHLVAEVEKDPLEEAENFLQKGRYPQAAGLFHRILQRQPERHDVRLRLMQCQAEMRDAESFAEQEKILKSSADAGVMAKVAELRSRYSFLAAAAAEGDSLESMEFDFNRSLTQTQPALAEQNLAPSVSAGRQEDQDVELPPLDLDFPLDLEPAIAAKAAPEELSFKNDELDFHLDELDQHSLIPQGPEVKAEAKTPEKTLEETPDRPHDLDFSMDEPQSFESHMDSNIEAASDELNLDDMGLDDLSLESLDAMLQSESAPVEASTEEHPVQNQSFGASLQDMPAEAEYKEAEHFEAELTSDSLDDLDFSLDQLEAELGKSGLDQGAEPELPVHEVASSLEETLDELELPSLDSLEDLDRGVADSLEDPASFESLDLPEDFDLSVPPAALPEESAVVAPEPSPEPAAAPDQSMDLGDDFDFLAEADENATKLDLAKAYMDMGDMEGARDILSEVVSEGSPQQQEEARTLLEQVG